MRVIFIFMFFCNIAFGQLNIELPSIKENNFRVIFFPYHAIYITKINEVYFDNELIQIHQIKEKVLEKYNEYNSVYDVLSTQSNSKKVHLFIDKNVKFVFFDQVLSEISTSLYPAVVIFRSNFVSTTNIYEINGIKHRLAKSFYNFSAPPLRITYSEWREKNEKNKEEELKEIDVLPPPTFDENSYNFISIEDAVYSIQQEIIDEVL